MLVFVKNFSIEQINYLQSAFIEIDKNKTGFVTAFDILSAMERNKYSIAHNEFAKLVENIDYIGKGKLNYSQFLIAAMDRKKEIDEEHLWVLFKHFDLDDDGEISLEELKYVLEKSGFSLDEREIEEMTEEFKNKSPHSMRFRTFMELMKSINEEVASAVFESSLSSRRISIKHHYTAILRKNSKEIDFKVDSFS